MSTISEDSPSHRKSILGRAIKRNNRITSPTHLSQTSSAGRKTDVIELFTIKPQSRTFSGPRKGKTKAKRRKVLTSDSQDTSELSDDVFAVTKQVSIESFAKSETKSYKERINERFESIKKKAGKSTKSANVFKETVNKILLEKVRRESSDVDVDLQSVRSKFNLTGRSEQRSELHNFFCSERNDQNEDDHTEEGEEFKSTDELTKDDSVARFTLPENVRFGVKIAEKDLFFTPKAKPVEINDKLEGKEPRHLEEEGFYVQKPPKVPLGHLHLLEQRLSKDDKKWFNCEGKLNIAESPVLKTSIRPPIKPLPTEETTAYLPAKITNEECEEIVVVRENVLQLQISTLTFAHHPLFSVEHVLAQNLKGLYSEYEKAESSNVIGRLRQKLEALRSMKVELQKRDLQSGDHAPDDLEKKMAYMREIKKLQDSLFTEGKMERDRLKSILAMWKAIKKVRVKNQYSNTSIRLVIKKTAVKYAEEKEEFKRQIDAACEETIEELRTKYDTPDEDDDDDDDDGNPSIDEDEIRTEVLSKFKESFRPPGEPILSFALLEDHEVTKGVEDSKEKARRNAVSLTKLCLKIICNKVEVCKTKFVTLTDTFVCKFDETISIQLINVPKFLTIEIIEHPKSLVKRTVGEIALKLPSRHVSSGNLKFKDVSFEKKEIVHYKHEGVGSGVKVQSVLEDFGGEVYEKRKKVPEKASENKEEEEELNSSGFLSLTLGWDTAAASDEYGEDPTSNSEIIGEIIDKNGVVDTDKLMEWLHQSKPDPQDPKNSVLYEYTREIDNEMIPERKNTSYFRLSPYIGNFQFCDPTVLDENIRLTILELRNNNEPEFDGMLVPNRIKEIPFTILADYRRRKAAESESLVVDDDHDEDEIEARRSRGRKCLKQIHIKIFQLCKNAQNNLTFEDVVGEELLVHFEKMVRSLVNRCINWLRWRPLKPSLLPQEQHKQHQDYQTATPVKIILKAMSATNIPNRSGSKGTDGKKEEVKPFVEVTYNDVQVRTSTAQGPNPVWNQELVVPLDSMHVDYLNPNSLNGTVVVNIFDEFDQVLDKFGGIKKKTWLGYLEISLSAICYTEMTGSFKVRLPQLLIGYEKETDKQGKSAKSSQSSLHPYLNLSVKVEPNIPKLTPGIEDLPCSEVPYLKQHALTWNLNYNSSFPNRKFSVFAIDPNGTTTCVVRYLRPLEPPQINVEGFDVTPEQCARFVASIPFTECNQFYQNIWLSVDQFLNLMLGSIIDHAIALTCYLLALKIDVWLLLGFGIPHGSTAYVLIKELEGPNQIPSYSVFDVVSGEKITVMDPLFPLQKVYCVINEHNVWANTQRGDNMTLLRFDLSRKSDWLPLFNNRVSAPTNSVHGKVAYLPKMEIGDLEVTLERKLKRKISKLRPLDRTIWNHDVSNSFKSALHLFENNAMYGQNNAEVLAKLQSLTTTYEISGHIINLPYTNVTSTVRRVQCFGLHMHEEPNVEFALAVHLRCYPNHTITMWLFAASVLQK